MAYTSSSGSVATAPTGAGAPVDEQNEAIAKPVVTGHISNRDDRNKALASLIEALASLDLIVDETD